MFPVVVLCWSLDVKSIL